MKLTSLVNRMRASAVCFHSCRVIRQWRQSLLDIGTASLGIFPAPNDENRLVAKSTLESRLGNDGARVNRYTSKAITASQGLVTRDTGTGSVLPGSSCAAACAQALHNRRAAWLNWSCSWQSAYPRHWSHIASSLGGCARVGGQHRCVMFDVEVAGWAGWAVRGWRWESRCATCGGVGVVEL